MEKIKKSVKAIKEKQGIFINHRFVKKDGYTPDEIADYIYDMGIGGFWSVEGSLMESSPCSEELAKDVYKAYLVERIDDLEASDLCGAPWCRVELKNLKYIYKNLDKWWK